MNPDDRTARILAENAGFEIVEVDGRVWFFDRRTRGPIIAAAVSGGVAAIALINGLLLTVAELTGSGFGGGWVAVAVVAGLSALGATICSLALELRRRRAECPRAELRPLAMVDRSSGMLLDANGRVIAPVTRVHGGRGLLIGSSAPAVVLRPPQGGRIEVFRGTLIGGGIEPALRALAEIGFAR